MAKSRNREHKPTAASSAASSLGTTTAIKSDPVLGYKIRVLLYDLRNMSKDRVSEQRTLATTDVLYISGPYFTPEEAALVKNAIVDHDMPPMEEPSDEADDSSGQTTPGDCPLTTVENTIHTRLARFLDKRRASGDARPFGPHDMAPLYEAVFGTSQDELRDEKFLARLQRQGLPRLEEAAAPSSKPTTKQDRGRK